MSAGDEAGDAFHEMVGIETPSALSAGLCAVVAVFEAAGAHPLGTIRGDIDEGTAEHVPEPRMRPIPRRDTRRSFV